MQTIINNVECKQMYFRKRGGFSVEGEDYTEGAYVTAYTKNEYPGQAAVQFNYATDAFAIYTMNVVNAGYYEILTVGNGTPTEGFIKGDLYIDNMWVSSTMLKNGNGWNVFANSFISNLGVVRLSAGEHTMKLVINGGSYVMDKVAFVFCTVTGTLTLEAEKYYIQDNTEEYSKPDEYPGRSAVMVGRNGSEPSSITWGVVTESEGTYDVTMYGNGIIYKEGGDTAITGKLYVDNEVKLTKELTITGYWNIFDDAKRLLTELGSVELTAGAHIIRLELERGSYVLDKVIFKLPDADIEIDDEASIYVPYKKVYVDDVQVFSAGNIVTYYVDGVAYQEEVECGNSCLSPTSFTPTKDGWEFLGWSSSVDSTSVLESLVMDSDPITLYAVFKYPDTEIALQAEIGSNTSRYDIAITNDLYYKISVTGDGGTMHSAQLYKNNAVSEANLMLNTYGDNTYAETTSFEDSSEYLFCVNTNYAYSIPKGTLMLYGKTVVG